MYLPMATKLADTKNIKVLQFLDAYEKQQSLWNPALESYKNKQAREEAYLNIIRDLNLPSLTVQDVKLKVKSIRTTYTKELRALTKFTEEGRGYSPKLFWFNRADSFLKNVSLSRDRRSSVTEPAAFEPEECKNISVIHNTCNINNDEDMEEPEKINKTFNDRLTTRSKLFNSQQKTASPTDMSTSVDNNEASHYENCADKKLYLESSNIPLSKIPEYSPHNVKSQFNSKSHNQQISENTIDDECEMFCHSVAAQLRSIQDPYARAVAKLKIQQILFEAETGHYQSTNMSIPVI